MKKGCEEGGGKEEGRYVNLTNGDSPDRLKSSIETSVFSKLLQRGQFPSRVHNKLEQAVTKSIQSGLNV